MREKKIQSRSWGLILPAEWKNCMPIVHKAKSLAKWYYWIRHDRDFYTEASDDVEAPHAVGEIKKEHLHLLFTFNSSRDLKTVRNYFSEFPELKENSFEKINNAHGAKRYLIHADNPEKSQYRIEEVETNDRLFKDIFVEKISSSDELEIIKKCMSLDVPLTFSDFLDCFSPVLVNMNSYQKTQTAFSILREWRYRLALLQDKDFKLLGRLYP